MTHGETIIAVLAAFSPFLLALIGGLGWLYRHERELKEEAYKQVSERKREAYIALLKIFFDTIKAIKIGKNLSEQEMSDRMIDASKELILYGSDDVVRIYQSWMTEARKGQSSLDRFGELVLAIRRDMGHLKTNIKPDEVLRQFIIDYDETKAKVK
jgi:hypothetical protein